MIRRPPRSTRKESSAASDVYKRQVVAGTGDEYEEYSECNGDDCSDSWRVYVIKYSDDGTLEWELTFGPSGGGDWAGEDICLSSDGGAVIAVDNGHFGFLKLTPF